MPPSRVRGTTAELQAAAVSLRQKETAAEQRLWAILRNRGLDGLKFRRQYPIGPYVLDFCCPEIRLVIEVDGSVNDGQEDHDQHRTEHFEAFGYHMLRFRNAEIIDEMPSDLRRISATAKYLRSTTVVKQHPLSE